jgi:hypothetical protein
MSLMAIYRQLALELFGMKALLLVFLVTLESRRTARQRMHSQAAMS